MASSGFRYGKYGAWIRFTKDEAKAGVISGLWIGTTFLFAGLTGWRIYRYFKAEIDNKAEKEKHLHQIDYMKEKEKSDKEIYRSKKYDDVLSEIILHYIKKDQNEKNGNMDNNLNDEDAPESDVHKYKPMQSLRDVVTNTSESVSFLATNVLRLGGVLVIFGPKGVGKSTLVMMLTFAIAEGKVCDVLPTENVLVRPPQVVFYYDLEMFESQMKARYGKHPELIPANVKWKHTTYNSISDWLDDVEFQTSPSQLLTDATIVIDNITKCGTGLTQPDVVTKMINRINMLQDEALKRGIHLSFVFVGHTTLLDQNHKPLSTNDLAGSANLGNFPDTIIGIARTKVEKHDMAKVFNNRNYPEPEKVLLLECCGVDPFLSLCRKDWVVEDKVRPNKNGKMVSYQSFVQGCTKDVHNGHRKKYTDEQMREFDRIAKEHGSMLKAEEITGIPHQTFQKRIKKIQEE